MPKSKQKRPWESRPFLNDWFNFQDQSDLAFVFLRVPAQQSTVEVDEQTAAALLANPQEQVEGSINAAPAPVEIKDRDQVPPEEITAEMKTAAVQALKYCTQFLQKVVFEVEQNNREYHADYVRWLITNWDTLQTFYRRLEKHFPDVGSAEDQNTWLRAKQFMKMREDVFKTKFAEYQLAAKALGLSGEHRISEKKKINKFLGQWKTYPPSLPGEADSPPDHFERGAYIERLGDLLKFVEDMEAYALLNQPLEEESLLDIIKRDAKTVKEWYAPELKKPAVDSSASDVDTTTPGDILTEHLNKVEQWYASEIVSGSPAQTYRDLVFNRQHDERNIKKTWEKTKQESQKANAYRQQDQEQFQKAVTDHGNYLQQSWYRKTLKLLSEYGPTFWERVKEDFWDIVEGTGHLLLLPYVLVKGISYDASIMIYKMIRDPEYRQSIQKRLSDTLTSVKNSIVSFFSSIKDMILAIPTLGTKQGWVNLWKNIKEKAEELALWVSQHPLKAFLWLVLGAGTAVGTHFLAPFILGASAGVASGAVTEAVIGVRLAAWFSASIVQLRAQFPGQASLERQLQVRIEQAEARRSASEQKPQEDYLKSTSSEDFNFGDDEEFTSSNTDDQVSSKKGAFDDFDFCNDDEFVTVDTQKASGSASASAGEKPHDVVTLINSKQSKLSEQSRQINREIAERAIKIEAREPAAKKKHRLNQVFPAPTTQKKPSYAMAFASHAATVDSHLQLLRLTKVPNDGGGDCLFYSIAQALNLSEERHMEIRTDACNYLQNHQELFTTAPLDDEEISGFIARMRSKGIYAEGALVHAVAAQRKLKLEILMTDAFGNLMEERQIINPGGGRAVKLLLSGQHYVLLNSEEAVVEHSFA